MPKSFLKKKLGKKLVSLRKDGWDAAVILFFYLYNAIKKV